MSPFSLLLRLALLATATSYLAACASTPSSTRPNATVNGLYAQLDQASNGYQTALEQSRAGHAQASQQTLAQSLDTLKAAAARCGTTPGCDPQRFFSVFDRLLRLKDGDFGGDQDLDSDIDPAQAALPSGKTGAASLPEAQRSVTLLHGQKLSEMIAMNGPTKAALEMWLTQWRPQLMDAYVNYQFMRFEMWPEYQKADLPEALLFGIMALESGGKVHAVSRSGAVGPLQFMYATGARFGLTSDSGFDMRYDPAASARANAEYLNEQLGVFNNNLELTIAAYNGGEGRLQRLVGADTTTSFYDPRIYNQLPQQTRDYVPMVLAAAWLFLHPDSYNLRFPKVDGTPGNVTLQHAISLNELTVCLGNSAYMPDGWFRTLRNLNPRLDPKVEQPQGSRITVPKVLEKAYASRCVSGPWPILANDLHTAIVPVVDDPISSPPPATRSSSHSSSASAERTYKVRRGDSLESIVRKAGCTSADEVSRINGLKHRKVKVGQVLRLPGCH